MEGGDNSNNNDKEEEDEWEGDEVDNFIDLEYRQVSKQERHNTPFYSLQGKDVFLYHNHTRPFNVVISSYTSL